MCRQWADKPGLLFSGTTWDTNINEFFVTTLMPLFQTATMTGLLTPGTVPGAALLVVFCALRAGPDHAAPRLGM